MERMDYRCRADDSLQPALAFVTQGAPEPRPLLVSLHTWSCGYTQNYPEREHWCQRNGWHMIQPDFRGPNNTPQAMGSDFAVSDIADAVAHMSGICRVDPGRVYLLGGSGGGHAALLMAGRAPSLWAGVSAWVPISDVRNCRDSRVHRTTIGVIPSAAWWQLALRCRELSIRVAPGRRTLLVPGFPIGIPMSARPEAPGQPGRREYPDR